VKSTPRSRKMSEAVKEAIAAILLEEVQDPRVALATVTSVDVSTDMNLADVYVVTHGDAEKHKELLAGLTSAKGRIRNSLGKRVIMRVVPDLRFRIDPSVDEGMRINNAIMHEAANRPPSTGE